MNSEIKSAFEISKDCEIVVKHEEAERNEPIGVTLNAKPWFVDANVNETEWVKLMCLRATQVEFRVDSDVKTDPRDCALLMEMILTPRITSLTVTEWEEQVKGTESAKKKRELKRYAKDIREMAKKEMLLIKK
jgi:hypothetical protein